jgi:hypothetical protein
MLSKILPPDEEEIEDIINKAYLSWRKYNRSGKRGQLVTQQSTLEYHVVLATIQHIKNHEVS